MMLPRDALRMDVPTHVHYTPAMNDKFPRMDKTAFSVVSLHDPPDDTAYWLSKTPEERIAAIELTRQILYGYEPATARLQRVLEIIELAPR